MFGKYLTVRFSLFCGFYVFLADILAFIFYFPTVLLSFLSLGGNICLTKRRLLLVLLWKYLNIISD